MDNPESPEPENDKDERGNENGVIGKIEGKTTPFGFTIRLFKSVQRTAFLSAENGGKRYLLSINSLWNDSKGSFARVRVVGQVPNTAFPTDGRVYLATPEQVKRALGLEIPEEKALQIGKLLHTDIDIALNIEKLGRLFITGRTGSGKSYTAGVILEELMKKQVPLIIIDRHGEYTTIKYPNKNTMSEDSSGEIIQDLDYLEGILEFGDRTINPWVDAGIEAILAADPPLYINKGNTIIINLRGIEPSKQENIVQILCSKIYNASVKKLVPPHFIVIDEAHLFAGKNNKVSGPIIKLIAQEGRKFGSNLIIITQKPQALDTTIRAQAGTWIIHKLTDINDVKLTINSSEGLSTENIDDIQNLNSGEAIITVDLTVYCPLFVKIRERYTMHGGDNIDITEFLKDKPQKSRSAIINGILKAISDEQMENATDLLNSGEKLTLHEVLKKLEDVLEENAKLKEKIKHLNEKLKEQELTEKTTILVPNSESDRNNQTSEEDNCENLRSKIQDLEKEIERLKTDLQALELERSGILVELNQYKDKYNEEKQRADKAIQLAEYATSKLKELSKKNK